MSAFHPLPTLRSIGILRAPEEFARALVDITKI
jgi:hypothetical protein